MGTNNIGNYRAMVAAYRLMYDAQHKGGVLQVGSKRGEPKREPTDTECARAIDDLLKDAAELPDNALIPKELIAKIGKFERKYVKRNESGEIVGFRDESR